MSYLVSDFLINPILRQARRLSWSSHASDQFDPLTNRRFPLEFDEEQNGMGDERMMDASNGGEDELIIGMTGRSLVSSPTEEQDGDQRQLSHNNERSSSTERRHTIPLRLASHRSDPEAVEDVSDNPLFNVTDRFRAESPMSMSVDSLTNTTHMNPVETSSESPT